MVTPNQTSVQVLGSAVIASPLQLAHRSGQGAGAFVPDEARVRYQIETATGHDLPVDIFFEKAGPRKTLFFEPRQTKAAIITCGGVCPGLNNVVRSAVMEFYYPMVYGIRYGYAGLNPKIWLPPISLAVSEKKHVDPQGLRWSSVLATTGQPRQWAG